MAKISKGSSPKGAEPAEKTNIVQFIMESIEGLAGARGAEAMNHTPYVDMYSTDREVVVEVEMPGVRPEDIDVTMFKNSITIKALKYECFEETNVNYVCMERSFGRIFRTVDVPFPVNSGGMKAVYKNGILKITLPRVEEKRDRPIKIDIESS
ncbi:MAG: Hsp20/alpha crystallin family protein [Deltaproteobacteria bacterium]|nr:Hsp20/alpha crystallin family protein [Deltaproteobacteria bacterium]